MSKHIIATRIAGNLYDVSYPNSAGFDRALPWSSVVASAKAVGAQEIHVDQSSHRADGEPATEVHAVQ